MLDWLGGAQISRGIPDWLPLPQVQEGNPEVMHRLDQWVQPMRRRARTIGFITGVVLVVVVAMMRLWTVQL